MTLEIGDLILVKGKGPVERVVKWAENGRYSHIAIYAGDNQVLEAQGGRLTGYAPLEQYAGEYDIGHVKATSDQRQAAITAAKKKIGRPYAWKLIFFLALKLIFHINRPYVEKNAEICSLYAIESWRDAGINLSNVDKPTPQDIADSPEIQIIAA